MVLGVAMLVGALWWLQYLSAQNNTEHRLAVITGFLGSFYYTAKHTDSGKAVRSLSCDGSLCSCPHGFHANQQLILRSHWI